MNIKTKIQLFSTMWLLIILLIINTAIYFLFFKITTDTEINRLQAQTETIVEALYPDTENEVSSTDLIRAYMPSNGMIRIIDEESQALLTVTKERQFTRISPEFKHHQAESLFQMDDGERFAVVYFPMIWTDGSVVTLEVTESLAAVQANMETLLIVLIIASLFVLIPSFIGGRLLSNLILRPINIIVRTMQEIRERGIFKKIELKHRSQDELYKLADTFNHMMDRLQINFEKQQQFVSDASHELKTPLTIIESYANMLKRWGTTKPDVLDEAIEAIAAESKRMKELTQQMLTLAKDESEGDLNLQQVELLSLCRQMSQSLTHIAERNITVQGEQDQIFALADEQKVKQVLYILLDNALKFSEKLIHIQVSYDSTHAYIAIEDQGFGIAQQEIPHIFDRFHRVDQARTRDTGGSGLGLSIAQRIIQAHKGTITVESEEGRGTTFIVKLPRVR